MKVREINESGGRKDPNYKGATFGDEAQATHSDHRGFVGGLWSEMGEMQLNFLKNKGLKTDHKFLDVGCGCLRAGRYLVDYLEADHYYGIDVNTSLIELGYNDELTDAQRQKLRPENLLATDRFNIDFDEKFDFAIAQSVFSHIHLNNMKLCLHRVAKVMKPGGSFFVTFFEMDKHVEIDTVRGNKYYERNTYYYKKSDMAWVADNSQWDFEYIGNWNHPRNQKMVRYTRTSGAQSSKKSKGILPRLISKTKRLLAG